MGNEIKMALWQAADIIRKNLTEVRREFWGPNDAVAELKYTLKTRNRLNAAKTEGNDVEENLCFSLNGEEIDFKTRGRKQKPVLDKQHSEDSDQNKRRNKERHTEQNFPELKTWSSSSSSSVT